MIVHVLRSQDTPPGGAHWVKVGASVAFHISADAVTARGAAALERAWRAFTRDGRWATEDNGGVRVESSTYFRTDALPSSTPVLVNVAPDGVASIALSAAHFTQEAVDGIDRAVSDCLARVPWYYRRSHDLSGSVGGFDEAEGVPQAGEVAVGVDAHRESLRGVPEQVSRRGLMDT